MEYTYNDSIVMEVKEGGKVLVPDQVADDPDAFDGKTFEVINEEFETVEAMFDFDRKELVLF